MTSTEKIYSDNKGTRIGYMYLSDWTIKTLLMARYIVCELMRKHYLHTLDIALRFDSCTFCLDNELEENVGKK